MDSTETTARLDARSMRVLFNDMGRRFAELGKIAEIAIFGGSALILMFDFRDATRDVDYVALDGANEMIDGVAQAVGDQRGIPDGWFNDAVSIFLSDTPEYTLVGDFPASAPGLRVYSASPKYIMAMKIMHAMRSSLDTHDTLDVWHLADACGVKTAEQARAVVAEFYPDRRIPRRNDLILEDLFEAKLSGQAFSRAIGY